jgi:hypothetical protein
MSDKTNKHMTDKSKWFTLTFKCQWCGLEFTRLSPWADQVTLYCTKSCNMKALYVNKYQPDKLAEKKKLAKMEREPQQIETPANKPSDRPKTVIACRPKRCPPPNKNKVDYLPKSTMKDPNRFNGCVLVPHPDPVKAANRQRVYFNPITKVYVN